MGRHQHVRHFPQLYLTSLSYYTTLDSYGLSLGVVLFGLALAPCCVVVLWGALPLLLEQLKDGFRRNI